ncbi:Ras-related protein Rab-40C [Dissostichus eleginoides]|uniref:Ras-related protein Rab-40C n=1 Tax=Dissostichus eleginoides TaxID=100907 RepID=A0AAD9ETR8_DISEL|nr:Ras-related protein Rab-40C [Dissostichus eleginoides]
MGSQGSPVKSYDYLLKFLLVGDSDVGKGEILDSLQDGSAESPYAYSSGLVERCPVRGVLPGCSSSDHLALTAVAPRLIPACCCSELWSVAACCIDYKTTTILLDGKRVKLELW